MPGQLQRNPLTGRVQRDKTTGKIRRIGASSSICCCRGSCECGAAGGGSLGDTLTAVFDGVTIPAVCFLYDDVAVIGGGRAGVIAAKYISFPINGTFCLNRAPGTCNYAATFDIDVFVNRAAVDGAFCDCASYSEFHCIQQHFLTAEIKAVGIFVDGVGMVFNVVVGGFGPVFPLFGGVDVFSPFFFAQDHAHYVPLDCGGAVTLPNQSYWFGPLIGEAVTGVGVFLNDDFTTIYPYPFEPPPAGLIDGGWPPPHTNYGGTVTLADAPC